MVTNFTTYGSNLFWEATKNGYDYKSNPSIVDRLHEAADNFRENGNYLSAGLSISLSITIISNTNQTNLVSEWSEKALVDYNNYLTNSHGDSVGEILALMKSYQELLRFEPRLYRDPIEISRAKFSVATKLADYLCGYFGHQEDSGHNLANGFQIKGPIEGPWEIITRGEFCTYTHLNHQDNTVYYLIDSVIELLILTSDFHKAWEIAQQYSSSFVSYGQKGWLKAIEALSNPEKAHVLFFEAADYLNQDDPLKSGILPDLGSQANVHTWEPHFRTRGYLALSIYDDDNFEKHFFKADEFASKFKFIREPSIQRFDFLITTLAKLLKAEEGSEKPDVRKAFLSKLSIHSEVYDSIIIEFVENAELGLQKIQSNRKKGLSDIGKALFSLTRLPILGESDSAAISGALDLTAIREIDGITNTWIHQSLLNIHDERILRNIMLRLFQNQFPLYAQIRHGPIEYGKDISVVTKKDDIAVLKMFQVKIGDITKSSWYKECRPQLEQMFQVPMPEIQIPNNIEKYLGVLLWNGHFSPYVEEIAQAWMDEQKLVFGREYCFLNLDGIVNYVIDNRLVNAFRSALNEYSIM